MLLPIKESPFLCFRQIGIRKDLLVSGNRLSSGLRTASAIFAVALFVCNMWAAPWGRENVLHSFTNNGEDGYDLLGSLTFDSAGNLYGTTEVGGTGGFGTVFELTPKAGVGWTEKVLHNFNNGPGGTEPTGGVIFDARGNLYGTTQLGGNPTCGCGTVFELTPAAGGTWQWRVLHNFNGTDGAEPYANLSFDRFGNLYGTTFQGGAYIVGTVFELTPEPGGIWKEKVLHNFDYHGEDGFYPAGPVVIDSAGNLYGMTANGGTYGVGTVFKLTHKANGGWAEKILHSFVRDGRDGYGAFGGLVISRGNLYGTTPAGGTYGDGTVIELTPTASGAWAEKVLHNFNHNGKGGDGPSADLILDAPGNLYGTTYAGGAYDYGVAFELSPNPSRGWVENVLHSFNGNDGRNPDASLIFDHAGNLYGTTEFGGRNGLNGGTVFEIEH
jgi:uncharacterized repeat protein (TIGR03803 family)